VDKAAAYVRAALSPLADDGNARAAMLTSMADLATTLSAQGRHAEVEKLDRAVLEILQRVLPAKHPDTLGSMVNLALAISAQGRVAEAEKLCLEVTQLDPQNTAAWLLVLDLHLLSGASAETAQTLAAAAEAALGQPQALEFLFQYVAWNLLSNRQAEYEKCCGEIAARYAESTDPRTLYLVARMGALAHAPAIERGQLVQMASRAVAGQPVPWHQHTLGLCLLRDGQEEAAIVQFNRSLAETWFAPINWLGLAIAHAAQGRVSESQDWLKKAQDWIEQNPLDAKAELHPHDRIACQLLLREAETLNAQPVKSPPEGNHVDKKP
jgi:tetratricopeptide (TPR) repeat protein